MFLKIPKITFFQFLYINVEGSFCGGNVIINTNLLVWLSKSFQKRFSKSCIHSVYWNSLLNKILDEKIFLVPNDIWGPFSGWFSGSFSGVFSGAFSEYRNCTYFWHFFVLGNFVKKKKVNLFHPCSRWNVMNWIDKR